jgi:predicted transcriptional regulator
MKTLSLKLEEHIIEETEQITKDINISRNRYINEALAYYNNIRKRELLAEQLKRESLLCRDESLRVLKEFEAIDENGN